ncbi:MAG: TonB-dependent receptor [Bacteroidetes bacterium]|nr:TonB-dependent receptor [Bacteroidota bacterium]
MYAPFRFAPRAFSVFMALFFSMALPARGQEADSLLSRTLDPIVVTAERTTSQRSLSTAGVSLLDARSLEQRPLRNPADLLTRLPGITVLDFGGSGWEPQVVTRGFYGGGEAEYVVVLINGRPINNIENGVVNWDRVILPPGSSVEVLRGGASSLYGDAAIGAVMNIITPASGLRQANIRARYGGFGTSDVQASLIRPRYSLSGRIDATDGYRDHSSRQAITIQGTGTIVDRDDLKLSMDLSATTRDYEVPGPIRDSDLTGGRDASLLFFRFDEGSETTTHSGINGQLKKDWGTLDASISAESRGLDLFRTLPLSADFADTQERRVNALSTQISLILSDVSLPIPMENSLLVGTDFSSGGLDSRYRSVATGGLDDAYLLSDGRPGEVLRDGTAKRDRAALFAHLDLNPTSALRVSLGVRADMISDQFEEKEGFSEPAEEADHTAVSPKAGINYRWIARADQVGNVYVSVSKSFKAPTLDQLYDLRAIPVPFPPYSVQIASDQLDPQRGFNVEAGLYHRISTNTGWTANMEMSVYRIDMTDEIDFSFDTFSNVNIGESRHQGIESGLRVSKGMFSAHANYALQEVTFSKGELKGNAVKAIPRHSFNAGLAADRGPLFMSLSAVGNRGMYVDDTNLVEMDNYATMQLQASWTRGSGRFMVDVWNLLDKEYSTTAYPDPAGSDVLFLYPAAGRTLLLGIEWTF